MDYTQNYDLNNKALKERYRKTLLFLDSCIPKGAEILDLGVDNPLSKLMRKEGYLVENTQGEDLDVTPQAVANFGGDVVTAFEIFEHLLNPMGVLQQINAKHLIASVPLALWFSKAYRNENDILDQHFHEFEDWQFDWLLDKSGWKILKKEKWVSFDNKIGIRPLLRRITPRYYIVHAVRK
jgi:hypothetical protein